MLVHYFWLLEFKFEFEFNCLIFSINLSKFRSLFLPLEVPARRRASPSASRPSRFSPAAAQLGRSRLLRVAVARRPASSPHQPAPPFHSLQPLTGRGHLSSPTSRPRSSRTRVRVPAVPACTSRRLGSHAKVHSGPL